MSLVMVGTKPGDGFDPRGVFDSETDRRAAVRFGMWLLYAALAMLFGAIIILLVALRMDDTAWPSNLPPLPWQLWLSTGLLAVESCLLIAACRRGGRLGSRLLLLIAFAVAVIFMACQGWAMWAWHAQVDAEARRVAVTALYITSGIHIVHVLGGLVPLGLLIWYPLTRHDTQRGKGLLQQTASYWHFLDAVWIVLAATLLLVV